MHVHLSHNRKKLPLFPSRPATVLFAVLLCLFCAASHASGPEKGPPSDFAVDLCGDGAFILTGINAGDLGIEGSSARSVEAWVYTRDFDDSGAVFSVGERRSEGADFTLKVRGETDLWHVVHWGPDISFTYPSRNRWVHFAVVHTGSETIVYADGTVAAREALELDTSAEEPFHIGWWPAWEHISKFNGKIARVRVWNRALSEEEVKENMNTALTGDEEGLAGYWPLNEGAGAVAKDLAGGNDGQFIDGPRWTVVLPFTTNLADRVVSRGQSVRLGPVELRDPHPDTSYRWYFDDEPLEGETERALIIRDITARDLESDYYVEVSDSRDLKPSLSNRVRLIEANWPMWRYDAAGSAETPHELPQQLHLHWVRELPESMSAWSGQMDDRRKLDFDLSPAPVVAGQWIFVPSSSTDSVTAYSIYDGEELWRFHADGPVRLAPAVWNDMVYFTSDDGRLYCLDAETGGLIWKFSGGPARHHLLGNERIISLWPARSGPVVTDDGKVFFSAGIWPLHGVFIYALDAESGEVVWVNDTTGSDYVQLPGEDASGYGGLAPQGYIAASEDRLVIAGGRTPPAFFDRDTGQLLEASFRPSERGAGGYAVHAVGRGGTGIRRNEMLASRVEAVSGQIDGRITNKLATHDRLFVTTEDDRLFCFGTTHVGTRRRMRPRYRPDLLRPRSPAWTGTARDLLQELGESEGYALMLGAGSGDLFRELILRSDLHIVVVEADAEKVRSLRDELTEAGAYGRRAAVIEADPASFSVQPYLFSLVLSENAAEAKIASDAPALERTLNLLRPYGGIAWLGMPSDEIPLMTDAGAAADSKPLPAALRAAFRQLGFFDGLALPEELPPFLKAAWTARADRVTPELRDGHVFAKRSGPLAGAGQWTHQYGDSANSIMSPDKSVRLPMGLLWFGGQNNHDTLPVKGGGPRPQAAGGRKVYLGVETISARCVYTGRRLWIREYPGIGHPFTNLSEEYRWREGAAVDMSGRPGAAYIGSPFVTVPDSIYLRYEERIQRLDPATGETRDIFALSPRAPEDLYGPEFDGENSYLEVPHSARIDPEAENWTCEFRVKMLSGFRIDNSKFVAKRDGGGGGFYIGSRFTAVCDEGNRQNLDFKNHIPTGEWVHVAVQIYRSENKLRVFINGEMVEEADSELTGVVSSTSNLVIGGDSTGPLQGNNCIISDVRIWKGVHRQPQQIVESMLKPPAGDEEGLAGHWPMRDRHHAAKDAAAGNDGRVAGNLTWPADRGYLGVSGDLLVTTSEPHLFDAQPFGDPGSYSGTSGRRIAVMDRYSGDILWDRRAETGFRHNAITVGEDAIFLIDGLTEKALEYLKGEEAPERACRMLALDLHSGEVRWSTEESVFGTFLQYNAEHDILLEGGLRDLPHPLEDEPDKLLARSASTGQVLWQAESEAVSLPAAMHGGMIIPARPGNAISILTGEDWLLPPAPGMTGDGEEQEESGRKGAVWAYERARGCNSLNAGKYLLLFRSGYAGFFDLEHGSGTGTFSGFRSGSTANLIPADGVLSALDYTRMCIESYPHQTSLAMIHMPGDSNIGCWTAYRGAPPDYAGYGINFGAPGTRADAAGLIWYESEGDGRRHPSVILPAETGIDWVAASWKELPEEDNTITISENLADNVYRIRLHFAEPDVNVGSGERVFDVFINGVRLVKSFDIYSSAGGALKPVVEEFAVHTGTERHIRVDLKRSADLQSGAAAAAGPGGFEAGIKSPVTIKLLRTAGSKYNPVISGVELRLEK